MTDAGSHQVQVRWSDVDALGHVNHSTVLQYFEVGRDAFLADRGIHAADCVIRRCEIDYLRELRPEGGYAEYRLDEIALGRTSVRTTERLLLLGQTAVIAKFVLVMWDGEQRRARELTDQERSSLVAYQTSTRRNLAHASAEQ